MKYGVKRDYVGYEDEYIKILKISDEEIQNDINKNRKHKQIVYDALCKRCGNENYHISQNNIGRVKSCGCYMKTKWKDTAEKHIGEKHNQLTIIGVDWDRTEYERNRPNGILKTFYFTECICGNRPKVSTAYDSLKSGHIKSCGCSKFNNPLIMEDLTGQTFGRLTVVQRDIERDKKEIEKNGTRSGNAHWLCQCSCGNPNLKSITGWQLKSGQTKSCGCYASEILIERNKRDSSKYNHHGKLKDNISLSLDKNGNCEIYDENDEFSFLISPEDLDIVSQYYWRKISEKTEPNPRKRYWITNAKAEEIKNGSTYSHKLHQIIAEQKYGPYDHYKYYPDHLDRNPDNNTRENLILKSNIENSHNRGLSRKNSSGKTGVYKNRNHLGWDACITVNYNSIYLGTFINFEDAVAARKEAELKYGFTCDDVFPEYDTN